jgi:small subunit ribosomal protein S36
LAAQRAVSDTLPPMDSSDAADSAPQPSPGPEPAVLSDEPLSEPVIEPVIEPAAEDTPGPIDGAASPAAGATAVIGATGAAAVIGATAAIAVAPSSAEPRSAARRRGSSPRSALRWITALWAALLVGASLLWPVDFGYDELQHFDMTYQYSQHPTTLYAPGQLGLSKAAVAIHGLEPNPLAHQFAIAPIAARGDRPTLNELGGVAISPGAGTNQMVQHPPLYYWLGAVILRLPGVSHLAWDLQFWLVRLLSVLLMLPVPLLSFGSARRLARRMLPDTAGPDIAIPNPAPAVDPASDSPAGPVTRPSPGSTVQSVDNRFTGRQNAIGLIAAVVPITVPNLIRDGSSVTNDSLLISATSFFLYFLIRICLGEVSKKMVAGASIAVTVALLTKGFALVLPPILLIGLIIGWRRSPAEGDAPRDRRQLAWVSGIYLACMVIGGLWWLRNLIRFSAIQVNGFGPGTNNARYGLPDNNGSFVKFLPNFLNQVLARVWGGFAIPDTPLGSSLSVYGWPAVIGLGLLGALSVRRLRSVVLLLLLGIVLTLGVMSEGSWSLYSTHSKVGPQAAQGRYLYHLILVLAVVGAVGWAAMLRPRLTNVTAYVVLLLALVTNASAWFMILDSWYSSGPVGLPTKLRNAVHGVFRWSPVPKPLTAAIFLLVIVTAVLGWLQLRRYCRSVQASEPAIAEG